MHSVPNPTLKRVVAALALIAAWTSTIATSPAGAQLGSCPLGTTATPIVWGNNVTWESTDVGGTSRTFPMGTTGVNMTMTLADPNHRNEDTTNPLVNLPTADGNWDSPFYTQTNGIYGDGFLTWVMNSLDSDELVTFTLDYDAPVLIPDFGIGDVDFSGLDATGNAVPHDSFQDEILLSAQRNGTPVGFTGSTGGTSSPLITVNDAANGQFGVKGGPYSNPVNGNLAPADPNGTVYLSTNEPVTSITFQYSNGPDDEAAEVARIATLPNQQWAAANWAPPMTGFETGVSNNHAVRINQFTVCTGTLTIGDSAWIDVDGDGVRDGGEPPLAGATVTLSGADGIQIDSAVTAADGSYAFTDLPPWEYTVEIAPPPGYTATYDLDLGNDNSTDVALVGADNTLVDFGLQPPLGAVDGTVFNDRDADGIYEPADGDTLVGGVTVDLVGTDLAGNDISLSVQTDAGGYFQFSDVPAGSYTLTETQPAGYDDGVDTAGTNAAASGADAFDISLGIGASSLGNTFAEVASASIAGTVVVDDDNDGVADPGETGITGVTVTLTGTDDGGNPVSLATTTDADGDYSFEFLRPGSYTVTETQPPGYLDGGESAGSEGGAVADDQLGPVALGPSVAATDYDFGELVAASISGSVSADTGDGIADATVTLTGVDDLGNPVSVSATTAADGSFVFDGLRPGTYTVTETQPIGYGDGPDSSVDGTAGDDVIADITLTSGITSSGNDFTETTSSLSGSVVDDGGNPIAGVEIGLSGTDDLGNPVSVSATTAADGSFVFDDLLSGTYTIVETQPVGYGDGGETDGSLANGTVADDEIAGIVVPAGTDATGYEFDETRASISGSVVVDVDGDGVADVGEVGIAGVTVTLSGTDDLGNVVSLSTSTDGAGNYVFDDLISGTYTVTETQPAGYVDGIQSAGSAGGTVGDDEVSDIALAGGIDAFGYDFGETFPGSIAGSVTDDGGNGIAGVTINLSGTDIYGNSVSDSVSTDGSGAYVFGELAPGTYSVVEVQPVGYGDGPDSSVDGVVGDDVITDVTVGSGDASVGNDFSETRASIAGVVFEDVDNDGVRGPGEAGIANVSVSLSGIDDLGNSVSVSATTAGDGSFVFDDLISGEYTVAESQPAGYLDGVDSAGSAGGDVSVDDVISSIVLGGGVDATGYAFGELVASSIAGTVFEDADNNGIQSLDEGGIADVEIALEGIDDLGNPVSVSATTAGDGSFVFDGLRPGTYTVTETQPVDYLDGIDSAGSAGGDASVDDVVSDIVLGGFTQATGYAFAELGGSSLSGSVVDDGGNPIAGVEIGLSGTDDLGNPVSVSATTAADGSYVFDGLRPGTYTIVETQPVGYGDGGEVAGTAGGVVADDEIAGIVVPAGTDATGYDFDETRASISGSVFHDLNDDGIRQTDESPIPGVAVTLSGTDDLGTTIDITVTTGSDGGFVFPDLIAGTYALSETQPGAYNDGIDSAGTAGGDTSVDDQIAGIRIDGGIVATGYTFAEVGTIVSGSVWLDTDRDGTIDVDEAGRLGGIELILFDPAGNVVASTTTDADGRYVLSDLVAGDYTLVQAQPGLYATSTPNSVPLTVSTGGLPAVDFGEAGAAVQGRIWDDDANAAVGAGDGIDSGEPGVAGVTIRLLDASGVLVSTTVTTTDGSYRFVDLPAGDYTVEVVPPGGQTLSPADAGADETVDSDADLLTRSIAVTLAPGETLADVDAGLQTEIVDLAVDLTVAPDTVAIGGELTYVATVANNGNAPIRGAFLSVELPANVSFRRVTTQGWSCALDGRNLACTYDDVLLPGQTLPPVEITTEVTAAGLLGARATVRPLNGSIAEALLSNNDDTAEIAVQATPGALPFTGSSLTLLLLFGGLMLSLGLGAEAASRRGRHLA